MYNYSEEILFLRKKVPNYPNQSTKWLFDKLRNRDNKFVRSDLNNIFVGKFYFMKYDLKKLNKSSKLEQFVPMFIVDYKPNIDKKVLWVLNLNFMPLNIKEAFFSSFLEYYQTILDSNLEEKTVIKETPFDNINYKNMWSELIKYGFEYAIREIRIDLINDIYNVSTDNLHLLTTLNTQALTGVDEKKLNDIWITKLKSESIGERMEDLLKIKSNYENIIKELVDKFKNLNNHLNS